MSGPVRTTDTNPDGDEAPAAPVPVVELTPSREAQLGGHTIHRSLPTRARRTVGAWCFLDHAPASTAPVDPGAQIGPHPHIGLQTVTWLLSGEVVHTDSIGSEQPIRPGELNLMTAGRGIAHAEQTPADRADSPVHIVQLWVAQPDATRDGAPAFEHHGELPEVEIDDCRGRVLVGSFAGATSPARADTDHFGVDIRVGPRGGTVPLRADHEHAVVVLSGALRVDGTRIDPDVLAYLGEGRAELALEVEGPTRLMLLGGTPFEARPLMWWNFVARTHEEVEAAYRDWQQGTDRFGLVASDLALVPAPTPPWMPSGEPFVRS